MNCQVTNLRDGTIEIQTDEGDCLILTTDEARTFQIEIENALFSIYSDDQVDLGSQIPIVANDMTFSLEDVEQLASRLEYLLNHGGREQEQRIDWLRVGY